MPDESESIRKNLAEFKQRSLSILDQARAMVESGQMESLAVFGRSMTASNIGMTALLPGSDACSLLGFAMVLIQGMVQYEHRIVESVAAGEEEVKPTKSKKDVM